MILKTFKSHAINDRTNYLGSILPTKYGGLPGVNAVLSGRTGLWPLVSAVERPGFELVIEIFILGANLSTLRTQLHQWFDPEDETPGQLVFEDEDGSNDRYLLALCKNLQPVPRTKGKKWVVTLQISGDVRLREVTPTNPTDWSITASGQTKVLTNNGQDEAYPILTITPTSIKTGSYAYKRFVAVRWRAEHTLGASLPGTNYPVDICSDSFDTAALVTGGKMQADGDDLRVFVDGIERDRWLDGINTTTTKVWVNLDFSSKKEGSLETALGTGDVTIDLVISGELGLAYPASGGILLIDSEIIRYTAYNQSLGRFTGCTRGAEGSTAATHSAGATIIWLQHEIYIVYGNSSASAPTVDDNYKPIFALATSTNTSWVYAEFGENDGLRTGSWSKTQLGGNVTWYGGNRGAAADPWVEMGMLVNGAGDEARYSLYNPCRITAANFTNGEKYAGSLTSWTGNFNVQTNALGEGWVTTYNIPVPSAVATWESWSRNETSLDVLYVGMRGKAATVADRELECADCTVTLNSSYTPTIIIGAEQGNYQLAATITNQTTGDAIEINFNMILNEDLEIDTDEKDITYLLDGSKQNSALTLIGGARRHWLPLAVGSNTFRFDDAGTAGVTIDLAWEERHYQ